MPRRGPKSKTVANGRRKAAGPGGWEGFRRPDLDPFASAEFDRLKAVLARNGTLGRTDPSLVVATARVLSMLDQAHTELTKDGMGMIAANGTPMPHPMISAINCMTMRLRGLLNDLGLTPKTSNLADASPSGEAATPWDGLLNVAS